MIVIRLQGGLGNQMFQYALGNYLAGTGGYEVAYDISSYRRDQLRDYELPVWRLDPRVLSENELAILPGRFGGLGWKALLLGKRPLRKVKEKPFGFHPHYLKPPGHAYLNGFWQSEKFFPGTRDHLVEAFRPARPVSQQSAEVARRIESTDAIAVHVRRTDYINHPLLDVCDHGYHGRCVAELLGRHRGLEAFVFSDDIPWCAENLSFDCPTHYVDHNSGSTAHEDLWLMSLCRRHVIANSSFAWWAAWLKQDPTGEVYAPTPWFNDPAWENPHVKPSQWLATPAAAPAEATQPTRRAA